MRIVRGRRAGGNRWGVQAAGGKFQHRLNLLSRYMELLDDFLDAGAGLKIFEHRRYGHTRPAEYPRTTPFARNAFNSGALRPVESSHFSPQLNSRPYRIAATRNEAPAGWHFPRSPVTMSPD